MLAFHSIIQYTKYGHSGTATVGRYQNSGAGTGTLDIKVLSQVGHPLPPSEFNIQFDDGEDMMLGRGLFNGIGLVII